MKEHNYFGRGGDGIGVEVCHPYVVEARRGMLFEQTYEMPLEACYSTGHVSLSLSRARVHGESICSSFISSLIFDPDPRELGLS